MEISPFTISQILAIFAFGADLSSSQVKKNRVKTLLLFAVSAFLMSIHFWLLDAKSAAALILLVSCFRFIISAFYPSNKWLIFFIGLNIVIFYLTYSMPNDWLPFAGAMLVSVGSFQEKDQRLREFIMLGSTCWLIYGIIIFTPADIFMQSFYLLTSAWAYYKFYLRRANKK